MINIIGFSTISKPFFYLAKSSIVICALFPFFRSHVSSFEINTNLQMVLGWTLLGLGSIVFTLSLVNLGKSTRVGIPHEETQLKVTGLYKYSRNPMYLGVFMLCAASCVYIPHLLNLIAAILVISIHHFIILKEEAFLAERFKDQWIEYKLKVRRYL